MEEETEDETKEETEDTEQCLDEEKCTDVEEATPTTKWRRIARDAGLDASFSSGHYPHRT